MLARNQSHENATSIERPATLPRRIAMLTTIGAESYSHVENMSQPDTVRRTNAPIAVSRWGLSLSPVGSSEVEVVVDQFSIASTTIRCQPPTSIPAYSAPLHTKGEAH